MEADNSHPKCIYKTRHGQFFAFLDSLSVIDIEGIDGNQLELGLSDD